MTMDCLPQGWKTWNVHSVLSYILMPSGLTLNLCVKEYRDGGYLRETLVGRQGGEDEKAYPGPHGFGYTCMRVAWRGLEWTVETGTEGSVLVVLVTPLRKQKHPAMLVLETGFSWNLPGTVSGTEEELAAEWPGGSLKISRAGAVPEADPNLPAVTRVLTASMDKTAAFVAGTRLSLAQAKEYVAEKKACWLRSLARLGRDSELYEAILCAMNWDTVYDPGNRRVISPVSRIWSVSKGGYMLFCWDNYFAGMMASLFDPGLAEDNFRAVTSEVTADGFIPNMSTATGQKTLDRSQPPVGSAMLLASYRLTGNRNLVRDLYPTLLQWNRWFSRRRMRESGALSWGSDPFEPVFGNVWETEGVNGHYGASLESGLDNSPMYDEIPFDPEKHLLCLEDVGLTGLYILDCRALIGLARICGREEDIPELESRLDRAESGLEGLWNPEAGFYCNRRTDTGAFSLVLSPTNFYALFSRRIPSERLAAIEKYYFDPKYFYGEYVIPSVMRCHASYPEQNYWRGRIWAPMNYLVYLAAREHGMPNLREDLARKSKDLLLKEWREKRHIHENYSADTGEGCDRENSDRFYHWGALLAVIWLHEHGGIPAVFDEYEAACLAELRAQLALQQKLRPEMREEDVVKFVFQGMLGVGHLVASPEAARARLEAEYSQVAADDAEPLTERISTAWVRLNLRPAKAKGMTADEIAARVFTSAQAHPSSFTRRDVYDFCLQIDPGEGMKKAAAPLLDEAFLPSHSGAYREAYRPAYRVLYDPRTEKEHR